MSVTVSRQLVREKAEELKRIVLERVPDVDVEYADWVELSGSAGPRLLARGFPQPRIDVNAYLLVSGNRDLTEQAATMAENEMARIWEDSGIVIQVRRTDVVWCRKSGTLEARELGPTEELTGPSLEVVADADGRDIQFLCFSSAPHEHEWGNVKPH